MTNHEKAKKEVEHDFNTIKRITDAGISLSDIQHIISPNMCEILENMQKSSKPLEFYRFAIDRVIEENHEYENGYDMSDDIHSFMYEMNRNMDEYEKVATRKENYDKFR
jgi:hypothetical protein